jgi:hypothetical protein
MARIRTIKPNFFRSHNVADLSTDACRITWAGLWTYCDDAGRGLDDARLVKGEIWPLHDRITAKVVEVHLTELADGDDPMICRYVIGAKRFLHVINWDKHQKINRPQPSRIDSCPIHDSFTESAVNAHDTRGERSREEKEQGKDQGKGTGNREASSAPEAPESELPGFDAFWSAYPRKVGKPSAVKAWKKVKPADHAAVAAGVTRWAAYWVAGQTSVEHIPHPSTWLNDRRWEDEPPPRRVAAAPVDNGGAAIAEYRRRRGLDPIWAVS